MAQIFLDDEQVKHIWLISYHRDSAFSSLPLFIPISRKLNWKTNAWNFSEE